MTVTNSVGIITAIFGNYDFIPPVPTDFDRAVLVSDVPINSNWENIVISPNLPSALAAKIPKFRPDLFLDTNACVWIDANCRDENSWLRKASDKILEKSELAFFLHPSRTSVQDEIDASRNKLKYALIDFESQFNSYKSQGFKDNAGLYSGGVIVWAKTKRNIILGNEWFTQNCIWNTQDQVSLPFVLFKLGITPTFFEEDIWKGPLSWVGRPTNCKSRTKDVTQLIKMYKAGYRSRALRYAKKIISDLITSRFVPRHK
jgi:hypothetical protein